MWVQASRVILQKKKAIIHKSQMINGHSPATNLNPHKVFVHHSFFKHSHKAFYGREKKLGGERVPLPKSPARHNRSLRCSIDEDRK